ncbi:MAG: NADH-quinone oxidoreductase subunit J family protein [Lacipirellulaceae bacterium]
MTSLNAHSLLFTLYAALACGFAIGVALSSNVVRMALYLVLSLAATSGLFFLAGADFVGAMQLMIYVGGTLVLLIFGVMLTAQQRFVSMRPSRGELTLACLMGAAMVTLLGTSVWRVAAWRNDPPAALSTDVPSSTIGPLSMALLGVRVDGLSDKVDGLSDKVDGLSDKVDGLSDKVDGLSDEAGAPARGPLAGYLLPFEVVSIHLLVVLVGAAYLARTRVAVGSVTRQTAARYLDDEFAPKRKGKP